jgi:DNA-binding XRE family transcriptional regulator
MNHGSVEKVFARFGSVFVVLVETEALSEGAFDDLSLRRHLQAPARAADDLRRPGTGRLPPIDQTAGVTRIRTDNAEAVELERRLGKHPFGAVAVLHVTGVNDKADLRDGRHFAADSPHPFCLRGHCQTVKVVKVGLFQIRLYYRGAPSSRGRMEKSIHTKEYAILRRLLREIRKSAHVTQVELAQRLGQGQSFVSKCERGELRLDVIQLRAFCCFLGTDLPTFVGKLEEQLSGRRKRET